MKKFIKITLIALTVFGVMGVVGCSSSQNEEATTEMITEATTEMITEATTDNSYDQNTDAMPNDLNIEETSSNN